MAGSPALLAASAVPRSPSTLHLPYRVDSGAEQMRIDAALLAWCAAGPDRAAFRAYGWARPTLSLGRAEPFPEGWNAAGLETAGVDVVRRPTGGDAVLHDGELAFATAMSLPGPWRMTPREFVLLVADAVADALRRLGVDGARVASDGAAGGPAHAPAALSPGSRPCFARTEPGEVRAAGFKVAGIASRFTRGAALSHASIPLSARHRDVASFRRDGAIWRSVLDGHARSVPELLGRSVPHDALEREIAAAFASRLGVPLAPAPFDSVGIALPLVAERALR